MPIQIGQRPDHGFDQPLGLMSDCHRRIEHFLQVLTACDTASAGGPLSAEQRAALEGALAYFATAAPRHTDDEEVSLFPRLRESGDPEALEALALVDRLEHEHAEADAHHEAVDRLVRRWLDEGTLAPDQAAELRQRLARLQALYREHIALEDGTLFPVAARALSADQIREIGREMAARRQAPAAPATLLRASGSR